MGHSLNQELSFDVIFSLLKVGCSATGFCNPDIVTFKRSKLQTF